MPAQTSVLFLSHWQGKAFRSSLIPLCKGLQPNRVFFCSTGQVSFSEQESKIFSGDFTVQVLRCFLTISLVCFTSQ